MYQWRVPAIAALICCALSGCSASGTAANNEGSAAGSNATTISTTPSAAATSTAPAGFSVDSVPVTSVALPPYPFFKAPDGLSDDLDAKDANIPFDGQWLLVGDKAVKVEGKVWHQSYALGGERAYTETEFHRNYENAIKALGGQKISTAQWTDPVLAAAGGRDLVDKNNYGAAPVADYLHDTYLIRTVDKEYWIDVSTGAIQLHGYVVVLEKKGMEQSLGFLDAAAMKQAIDATGHVALYINFDLDKASLRPDAHPILAEVDKLLVGDPKLRLSIDGHTDNSGNAQHNRDLSTARARSVLGALVGLGIDPGRLQSRGFGADKPIADNATDAGRAKNRRVELVKL